LFISSFISIVTNDTTTIIVVTTIALLLGFYVKERGIYEAEVELLNGRYKIVEVYNSDIACPIYCEVNHRHMAHSIEQDCRMGVGCFHYVYKKVIRLIKK